MRTKTLLIASAVALAAAVTSTQAQTVYSQNIVGYVNQTFTTPGANYFLAAPLVGTNSSAESLMSSSLQQGDELFIWTGNTYISLVYVGPGVNPIVGQDWDDLNNNFAPSNSPSLSPGQGFFYSTGSGSIETNTWTGTVVLSNQLSFTTPGANYAVGSSVPLGASLENTNINLPLQQGDEAFIWTGNTYISLVYVGPGVNPIVGQNWDDLNNNFAPSNAPTVGVGQGFFYSTGSGSAETWTQNDSYINP